MSERLFGAMTPETFDARQPAFFRFRQLPMAPDKVVLSNLEGRWLVLDRPDFLAFAQGQVSEGTPLFQKLRERNFLRAYYDVFSTYMDTNVDYGEFKKEVDERRVL